jgi:hypothetical protein
MRLDSKKEFRHFIVSSRAKFFAIILTKKIQPLFHNGVASTGRYVVNTYWFQRFYKVKISRHGFLANYLPEVSFDDNSSHLGGQ